MTAPLHETHPAGPGRALPDTQQGMRRRNLARVMHTVRAEGPLSRAAVSSRIGLTRAAVSTLVDELIRSGLLRELGPERPGRVGRPGPRSRSARRGPPGSARRSASTISPCAWSTCAARSGRGRCGTAPTGAARPGRWSRS
ncbi:hypothetical protein SGLAM104S_07678 [Streptomyces glaucescens]